MSGPLSVEPVPGAGAPLPVRSAGMLAAGGMVLTAATYGLIVLGALVRAHGAGLACPDWPLCFGEVVPEFDLRVAFEWGHRALAGGIALGFAGFATAVLRRPDLRRSLGRVIGVAALLLALQIVLGALTVWELLASWTVTSHLVTGNAFAATLLVAVAGLRDHELRANGTPRAMPPISTGVWLPIAVAGALLAFQMVLGGLVASRFVGLACPEWPACLDGEWFPSFQGAVGLQVLHRTNGYALWTALAWAAWSSRGEPGLGPRCVAAILLGTAQIAVGAANVLWRIPVEITGLHSALAAALVALTVLSLRDAWLRLRRPGATTAPA
ncbi:MAG: COX15/CtaA family protein [Myxococcota bacterium]